MSGIGRRGLGRITISGISGSSPSSGGVTISGTPPSATAGAPYSFTPTVSGGSGANTFTLIGTLPTGLTFNTSTGGVTGTPTAAGTSSFAIGVVNAGGYAVLPMVIAITASAGGSATFDSTTTTFDNTNLTFDRAA